MSLDDSIFRKLAANCPDGIYIRDKDSGKVVWVNDRLCEVMGKKSSDIIGRDLKDLLIDTIGYTGSFEEQEVIEFSKGNQNNKGVVIQILSHTLDDKYVVGYVRDITALRETYKALSASERKFSALIEAARAGICVVDESERLTFVNRALLELLGYKEPDELVGRNFSELTTNGYTTQMEEERIKRIQGQYGSYESKLKTKEGKIKDVMISLGPLTNDREESIGSLAIISDLTEKLKYSRRREKLAQIIRHELKNPLQVIQYGLDALRLQLDEDEPPEKILSILDRNVSILARRINALRDLDLIEKGFFSLNLETINTKKFLEVIESSIAGMYDNERINFELVVEKDAGSRNLVIDLERISEVIYNLVENATKHSPSDSTVNLTCMWSAKGVRILVEDKGAGLSKDQMEKLFEPFYTEETQYHKKGMGLGLFIVKSILDKHNGTITVLSEPNKGTTFDVFVPNQK
ncbi:MAG: PAS domain-containing sensor histidine kinase [Candidatus Hodarchaeales archaeon]